MQKTSHFLHVRCNRGGIHQTGPGPGRLAAPTALNSVGAPSELWLRGAAPSPAITIRRAHQSHLEGLQAAQATLEAWRGRGTGWRPSGDDDHPELPGPGRARAPSPSPPDSTRRGQGTSHGWHRITGGTAHGHPGARHPKLTERPTCSLFCSTGGSWRHSPVPPVMGLEGTGATDSVRVEQGWAAARDLAGAWRGGLDHDRRNLTRGRRLPSGSGRQALAPKSGQRTPFHLRPEMQNGLRHMALYKSAVSPGGGVPQGLKPVPKCHTLETVFPGCTPHESVFPGEGVP